MMKKVFSLSIQLIFYLSSIYCSSTISDGSYWRIDTLKLRYNKFIGWHYVNTYMAKYMGVDTYFPEYYSLQSNDTLVVIYKSVFSLDCMRDRIKGDFLKYNDTTTIYKFIQTFDNIYNKKGSALLYNKYIYSPPPSDCEPISLLYSNANDTMWIGTTLENLCDIYGDSIHLYLYNIRLYSSKIEIGDLVSVGLSKEKLLYRLHTIECPHATNIKYIYFQSMFEDNIEHIATMNREKFFLPTSHIFMNGFCAELRNDTVYRIYVAQDIMTNNHGKFFDQKENVNL